MKPKNESRRSAIAQIESDVKRSIEYLLTMGAKVTRLAGDGPFSQFHLLAKFDSSPVVKAIHVSSQGEVISMSDLCEPMGAEYGHLEWTVEIWRWGRYEHKPTIERASTPWE